MSHWHAIGGYNEGVIYGYGTTEEARIYCDLLDAGRAETNTVTAKVVTDPSLISRLETGDEGFDLADGITHLHEAVESR